ncbi:MAG: DUF3786 domain-containing protein [Syntrophobacteraceae bacterium]
MTETESQYVKVHTLANRFEADVLMEALRREGIPALLRGFEETPYTGLFVPQRGWGRIMVPAGMEMQARDVIRALIEDIQLSEPPYESAFDIDPRLWEELREADLSTIIKNASVEFDPEEDAYIVPFLNSAVLCYPEAEKMELIGPLSVFSQNFQLHLVVLHYLLGARDEPLSGKWISEKDLPSGTFFFQGPHALPTESLTNTFDAHPELLELGARRIGGEKSNPGDLSYQFRVLPRIPLLTLCWLGDDEFEPSFHILFDETIMRHLGSLDLVWALVNIFTSILTHSTAQGGQA